MKKHYYFTLFYYIHVNHIILTMEADPQPQKEEPKNNQHQKGYKKGEPREKKPRPERKNEYEYNAEIIDQNTVIPPLPKKSEILPKPDIKTFKEKQQKNQNRIQDLINKKKDIRTEKFKFNRKNQGQGDNKHETMQGEISEVQQLRDKLAQLKVQRNKLRDDLHNAIEKAKANNEKIKEYRGSFKGSREKFSETLEDLQHRQMTKSLTKEEEKQLNNQIVLLKRQIRKAEASGNIQNKLEQAEELKDQLNEEIERIKIEKDPIQKEFTFIKQELDKRNLNITQIKGELSAEKGEKTEQKERHDKEYEAWKENKKVRLDKLEAEIVKLRQQNNKLWDDYQNKQDQYWKQKNYIDFIQWQERTKKRIVNNKERQAKKAEYQKRDQQREKQDKLRAYLGQIELINQLITYLNNLKSDNQHVEQKKEVKLSANELTAKLSGDQQWKKEKGLQILQSKKSKEDEEPEKKHKKKNKKKEQEKKEEKFLIPFSIQSQFEVIRVLPPTSAEEIDAKIKELKERQALFERVAKEQSNQQQKKLAEEIKGKQSGKNKTAQTKPKKIQDQDFPTI